ncbi:hypothetical protein [Salinivibrio proteolyticus]|uniref:Uncharacterized protein n=1 Tax=Salinivibrio proteolyticus TaxID=334715 RepID=A0ABY7LHV2_9GAMM|nr:hypothetical protein [Salinivibrio proteolyticus]WBA16761.1 hypothetical protein N7E60_15410 [Salinivibrio proteolyticus]
MDASEIISHFEVKQRWMACHVKQAQYPTAESLAGFERYHAEETLLTPATRPSAPAHAPLTLYWVDNHPLMLQYAKLQAAQWPDDARPDMLAYFAQLALHDGVEIAEATVSLCIGTQHGETCAAAMRVDTQENGQPISGIYDLIAPSDDARTQLLRAMMEATDDNRQWVIAG